MKLRLLLPALLLTSAAGCGSILDTTPQDQIPTDRQIVDGPTAEAALVGAYDGLQAISYYGRTFLVLGDLPADNAQHNGTFQYLGDVDRNKIAADNTAATNVWGAIYEAVARVNTIIAKVPGVSGIPEAQSKEILGESYALRALHYHNLVKLWGGVPMPLEPITSADDAAKVTRAPVSAVYTQILSDLDQAATLVGNTADRTRVTKLFVPALRARVLLYKGDYAGALAAANLVLAGRDTLTVPYADLFTVEGTPTSEDVFRVSFTAQEYNEMGYYYLGTGRREVAPTRNLNDAYEAGDVRKPWTVQPRRSAFQGTKFPTTVGAEDLHVIRLAEVVLIKAEALARQNQLVEAVAEYDKVRVRAKLAPHVLGVDVTTQAQVLLAIEKERRLELALEGDRWPDLVRSGRATAVLGVAACQTLFPIPARELIVAGGMTQNPPCPN
jgi:hypothetical protein